MSLTDCERCHNGDIYKKEDGRKLEKGTRNDSDLGL